MPQSRRLCHLTLRSYALAKSNTHRRSPSYRYPRLQRPSPGRASLAGPMSRRPGAPVIVRVANPRLPPPVARPSHRSGRPIVVPPCPTPPRHARSQPPVMVPKPPRGPPNSSARPPPRTTTTAATANATAAPPAPPPSPPSADGSEPVSTAASGQARPSPTSVPPRVVPIVVPGEKRRPTNEGTGQDNATRTRSQRGKRGKSAETCGAGVGPAERNAAARNDSVAPPAAVSTECLYRTSMGAWARLLSSEWVLPPASCMHARGCPLVSVHPITCEVARAWV